MGAAATGVAAVSMPCADGGLNAEEEEEEGTLKAVVGVNDGAPGRSGDVFVVGIVCACMIGERGG